MGLDFLIFREGKGKEMFAVAEDLQKAIFSAVEGATDSVLGKIKDCYKTSVSVSGAQLTMLLRELRELRESAGEVAPALKAKLLQMIHLLEDDAVYKVHIAGE